MMPAIVKPDTATAAKWRDFAVLASDIGAGKSKAYGDLRDKATALRNARPFGVESDENPCVRLRKLAIKVGFAVSPKSYHGSLRALSSAVMMSAAQAEA